MTLTEADVARLREAGQRDFFFVNENHDLQLTNVNGHCCFLCGGQCSVYRHRPEGCRFYPFVLDLDQDRVKRDRFCPWAEEFKSAPGIGVRLRRSVATEEREAKVRREAGY